MLTGRGLVKEEGRQKDHRGATAYGVREGFLSKPPNGTPGIFSCSLFFFVTHSHLYIVFLESPGLRYIHTQALTAQQAYEHPLKDTVCEKTRVLCVKKDIIII